MDEQLDKLLRELSDAINHAVSDSEAINLALARLRDAGHKVFLALEATIALSDKSNETNETEDESPTFEPVSIEERLADISDEDRQFLRALKIKFDPED